MNKAPLSFIFISTMIISAQSIACAAEKSFIEILSMPTSVAPGAKVCLKAKTEPKAHCTIEAQGAGVLQAAALRDQDANANGIVTWTFQVDKNYKADKMPIIIDSSKNNVEKKLATSIVIKQSKTILGRALELTSITSPGQRGGPVTVKVKTEPGATVKIEANGLALSEAAKLQEVTADKNGDAAWTFQVASNYKADLLPVVITSSFKGTDQKLVDSVNFGSIASKANKGM